MEDLRYPIGPFTFEPPATQEQRRVWIEDIARLPAELRAAVAGLGGSQQGTPYREGGWTVRQVAHHLADSHTFTYTRFLRTLSEDAPLFQSYDEKVLADLPAAKTGPLEPSLELLAGLHERWRHLLERMTEAEFGRVFRHPERGEVTLEHQLGRSSWHGRHHTGQILTLRRRMGW